MCGFLGAQSSLEPSVLCSEWATAWLYVQVFQSVKENIVTFKAIITLDAYMTHLCV